MGDYDAETQRDKADDEGDATKAPAPKPTKTRQELEDSQGDYASKSRAGYQKSFQKQWNETRADAPRHDEGEPFGGGHGKQYKVYGKHAGEGGFGARLLDGSAAVAAVKAKAWGTVADVVTPQMATLDAAMKEQLAFIEEHSSNGDPAWVQEQKALSQAIGGANLSAIERYRADQITSVTGFNSWVPLANQSHRAMAEMVEAAGLLGFDTSKDLDSAAFVSGLEQALDMAMTVADAPLLGKDGTTSLSHRADDHTANAATIPQLQGSEVNPTLNTIAFAYRELEEAHAGVYAGLLEDRADILASQIDAKEAQMAEIMALIEFWGGLGNFVQAAARAPGKLATTAEKVEAKHANGDRYAKRELGAAKTKAEKHERDQSDYDAHLESHVHEDNWRSHYDTWGKGGEEKVKQGKEMRDEGDIVVAGSGPSAPPVAIPQPPPEFSLGGFVKMAVGFLERGKLDELKKKIERLTHEKTAVLGEMKLLKTRAAAKRLENAQKKFEGESKKIEAEQIRKREQDMVTLGSSLDAYAGEHRGALVKQNKSAVVPKDHHEIYATAFAVLAKIEKFKAISTLALATFPYNSFVATATKDARERARQIPVPEAEAKKQAPQTDSKAEPQMRHVTYPAPDLPPLGEEEAHLVQQIAGSYLVVLEHDTTWSVRLAGVSSKLAKLMAKLSGQGGAPGAVGRGF